MKPYGRKNPIMYGVRKVKSHSRRGNVCPVCNNTKVNKKSARQKAKEEIRNYKWAA